MLARGLRVASLWLVAALLVTASVSPLAAAADGPTAPLIASSVLGAERQVSLPTTPECDRYQPAVAYNSLHGEYLVV